MVLCGLAHGYMAQMMIVREVKCDTPNDDYERGNTWDELVGI